MTSKLRRGDILAVAVLAGAYLWVRQRIHLVAVSDPDSYMHLAIARMVAASGHLLTAWPQASNIAWRTHYPNPYPLFHAISGILYSLGGEKGALALVPTFAIATLVLVYAALRCSLAPGIALLVAVSLLIFPFINRIVIYRPFVCAIFFFTMMIAALIFRSAVMFGVGCALYCLSYHLLTIPTAVVGIAALVEYAETGGRFRAMRFAWAGVAGLALGILADPSFPQNLEAAVLTATEALNQSAIPDELKPVEMLPLPLRAAVVQFGVLLGWLWIAPFWLLDRKDRDPKAFDWVGLRPLPVLFLVATATWVLSFITARALEYAIPTTVLFIGVLLARRSDQRAVAVFALSLAIPFFTQDLAFLLHPLPVVESSARLEAVNTLPADASGKKVLNCEWYIGAYIAYARPQYRFVDLNDPLDLVQASAPLFTLRESLRHGELPYPYGVARFAFDSDYVLCEHPMAIDQLEFDPHFDRIFPARYLPFPRRLPGALYLFQVKPDVFPSDVFDLEISPLPAADPSAEPTAGADWQPFSGESHVARGARSPYLNLGRWLAARGTPSKGRACVAVRPTGSEIERHRGAHYLGLGGTSSIRVWRNDRLLIAAESPVGAPQRTLGILVPLPQGLQPTDRLTAAVCGDDPQSLGVSLSFFEKAQWEGFCHGRQDHAAVGGWKVAAPARLIEQTCLAPVFGDQPTE